MGTSVLVAFCGLATASASFFGAPALHRVRLPGCAVRAWRGPSMDAQTEAPPSFVQTEMRSAAMKLHSRDQSREGEQKAQTPVAKWEPGRAEYLQFLVDSRNVYQCFEEIVAENDALDSYRDSGLERVAALDKDIAWFQSQGLETPPLGRYGTEYAAQLRQMAADEQWETLTCHFYNFYFAHTAGGRMIGKMMADKLLDGRTLNFYQWERGDPKEELLPRLRDQIDRMASGWTREQKDACLAETAASFKGGGSLLKYLREPPEEAS
jgi:heme oxygenase